MWYKDPQIKDSERQLKAAGVPVFPHIRRSDKVDKMTYQQDPLLISSPNSAAGVDYRRFVKEYVGGK
jgi:chromosome partitioning protein